MSDVRARLADALRDNGCHPDDAAELADVLLSLPGIAIVELPEAKGRGMTDWPATAEFPVENHPSVRLLGKTCIRSIGGDMTSDKARALAAALLAAANAAESVTR